VEASAKGYGASDSVAFAIGEAVDTALSVVVSLGVPKIPGLGNFPLWPPGGGVAIVGGGTGIVGNGGTVIVVSGEAVLAGAGIIAKVIATLGGAGGEDGGADPEGSGCGGYPDGRVPNSNPNWGRTRLINELQDRGFVYKGPAKSGDGQIWVNPKTGEAVRIAPRPKRAPYRDEPPAKFENEHYYRYQKTKNDPEGPHQSIQDH